LKKRIIPAAIVFILFLSWTVYLFLYYGHQFPLRLVSYFLDFPEQFHRPFVNLLPLLPHLISAVSLIIIARFIGICAIRMIFKNQSIPTDVINPLACLLGFFALGMMTFFLGVVGLLYKGVFFTLTILLFIMALYDLIKTRTKPRDKSYSQSASWNFVPFLIFLALAIVCLAYTMTPPIQSDALRYHLAAPQEYIKRHRIHYIPLSAFSNFPFLIEMLFLYGMLLTGDLLANLIHYTFWVISFFILRGFISHFWDAGGKKEHGFLTIDFIATLCALVFVSIPAVAIVACWQFIDIGLSAYFSGFILCFCLCLEKREPGYIILTGIMGGALMGIKYTMIPVVLFGCCLLGIMEQRRTAFEDIGVPLWKRPFFMNSLRLGMIALLCAMPWYLKNILYTGNPLYPMLYRIFGGRDWSTANAAFYAAKASGKGLGKSLVHFLVAPIESTLQWRLFEEFNPGPFLLYSFPFLLLSSELLFKKWWRNIFLVLLSLANIYFILWFLGYPSKRFPSIFFPLAVIIYLVLLLALREAHIIKKKRRKIFIALLSFAGFYYILWFFGYQSNRFLIPLYVLSALIFAGFIIELRKLTIAGGYVLSAGLLLCALYSSAWSARWILTETQPHPLPVFLGMQSREEYLSEALDYYPAIRAVNTDMPPDEAVLCIGEHRACYFKPRLIISDWFDTPAILDLIRKTKDNNEIFSLLSKKHCTHIFFNKGELDKYHDLFFKPRFSPSEYQRFSDFMKSPRLHLRYQIGTVFIYRIDFEKEG